MRVNFRKIDEALDDIENYASYYVGGTLCIDFKYRPSVGLNRNGRGFAYQNGKQVTFLMTKEMQQKVNDIYRKYKGGKNVNTN